MYGSNQYGQCGVSPAAVSEHGGPWLSDAVKLDRHRDFVPPLPEDVVIEAAATGAAHTLLRTSKGVVYAAGTNTHGQCGRAPQPALYPFRRIDGPFVAENDVVVDISCGRTFSALVTAAGHGTYSPLTSVYTMGSAEYGVLGTGLLSWHHQGPDQVQHRIQAVPMRVPSLHHIMRVSCGEDHAMAYVCS